MSKYIINYSGKTVELTEEDLDVILSALGQDESQGLDRKSLTPLEDKLYQLSKAGE